MTQLFNSRGYIIIGCASKILPRFIRTPSRFAWAPSCSGMNSPHSETSINSSSAITYGRVRRRLSRRLCCCRLCLRWLLYLVRIGLWRRGGLSIPHTCLRMGADIQDYGLSHYLRSCRRDAQPIGRHSGLLQDSLWYCHRNKHHSHSYLPHFSAARSDGRTSWNPQSVVHHNWHLLWLLGWISSRRWGGQHYGMEIHRRIAYYSSAD